MNRIVVFVVVSAPIRFEAYHSQHDHSSSHQSLPTSSSNDYRALPSLGGVSAATTLPPQYALRAVPTPNAVVANGRVQPFSGRTGGEPPPLQIINR